MQKLQLSDVLATGEAFNPQNIQHFKIWNSYLFSIFKVIFTLLDPYPADQNQCGSMRIRIRNPSLKYKNLAKIQKNLSHEGRLRSWTWFRFGRPSERTRNRIHKAVTTTRANGVRELLVCLGRDGDTRLVRLHLANVVELRHPVARLHKPFLQKKKIIQSILESINQRKFTLILFHY